MKTADGPIILIGAARSGTKIMRDSLAEALGAGLVPYDVGFVWRYGNEGAIDDCLAPSDVKPRTRRLVRSYVGRYADQRGLVVEKTVGNTLRVPFVSEIFPNARFVELIRNGIDVTESSRREWQKPADLSYLRAKARHFPMRLVPTYGVKFIGAQTWSRSARGHVATWGPRYPGIDSDLETVDLLSVCARQWRESVKMARNGFVESSRRPVSVRFEDFLDDPQVTLARVVEELGEAADSRLLASAASKVSRGKVGSGRASLSSAELEALDSEIGNLLEELGYDRPC